MAEDQLKKLKRAHSRRGLALTGCLLSLLPTVLMTVFPSLANVISIQFAYMILLILPVCALLALRAHQQVRRLRSV